MPPVPIDRASPVPLYFQVAQHFEQAISAGALPSGSLLPNEVDLADAIGVSRPTVRRAMQILVEKGLLVRRRGVGTRIVQPKMRRPLELTSLHDDLTKAGQTPTTTVLSFSMVPAVPEVAEKLGLSPGDEVLELVRLRAADGKPIAKLTNYLPAALARFTPDDLERRGLYDLIRGQGIVFHSADQTIGAKTASAADSKLLDERGRAALLTAERVAYDDHGRAVEYGTHLYAASRYGFAVSLMTG
jgi:GntR family transcriptional regulator